MNNNTEFFNILGLENSSSIVKIKKAYNSAKKVWTIDESASDKLKTRCKTQLKKIDEAYDNLLNEFNTNISKIEYILQQVILYKSDKSTDANKLKINSTDKEYSNFKIKTKDVEFSNVKVRYWWRALYLSLILAYLNILYLSYPLDKSIIEQRFVQTQQSNASSTVQKTTIKDNKTTINNGQNNTQTNQEIKSTTKTEAKQEPSKENKKDTTSVKHQNENKTIKEKQVVNKTENKAKSVSQNKKQETNTTNNGKKNEYHLTKQNVPVLVPVKEVPTISPNNTTNANNKVKTNPSTSRSDFNAVSDYFE